MQVGDLVQVTGTVKDIVTAKDSPLVSVLVGTDPDGREYWFVDANVSMQSTLTKAEQAAAAAAAAGTTGTAATTKPQTSFPPVKSRSELESMTKAELEAYGKKLGLDLHSGMPKDDMIDEIENAAQPK